MNTTKYDEKLKPLFDAVKKGDYLFIERWIKEGNPLFNPESKGRSVLYYAVTSEFFSILEILLSEDWTPYEKPLNKALYESVLLGNADFVLLLLDKGASPNECSWYEVIASKNERIVSALLQHGKAIECFAEALDDVEVGVARALKQYLPSRPDIEEPILKKLVELQYEIYLEEQFLQKNKHDEEKTNEREKKFNHLKRLFSLLKWTGVNTRRKVDFYDENVSVMDQVVCYGSAGALKSLFPGEADIESITNAARKMKYCDEKKLKYLQSLGLVLNDRTDGTSSIIQNVVEQHNFMLLELLLKYGAKPRNSDISEKSLKDLRYYLFHCEMIPGTFQSLAQVLTQDQMRWILRGGKIEELFGDKPEVMIKNLYDPQNSESPLLFDEHMKRIQKELNDTELHQVVRKFQQYCIKHDQGKGHSHQFGLFHNDTMRYDFEALQCSKAIRPWILFILNRLVPICEKRGAKFIFEESRNQWCNDLTRVKFIATIGKYQIPLEFHERTCHVKSYLVLSDGKIEDHTGTLQFCHRLHGNKVKMLEEKHRMEFDEKIEKLCEKLFGVVELEKTHEQVIAEREEYWKAERRKQEELERQRLEELLKKKNRIEDNKAKFKAILDKEIDFHNNLVKNAKLLEETRLVRIFIDETRKRWTSAGPISEKCSEWLRMAELMLAYHDPFCTEKPKMLRDVVIPESLWDGPWENIVEYAQKWQANLIVL